MNKALNLLCSIFFLGGGRFADIETYNVDTQLNKVTVTGNVTTEEVIKVLHKISKTAIPWQADEVNNQVNNIT